MVPSCELLCLHVQLLSGVWLFATPWIVAHQTSLSFSIAQSLLKIIFIESVMPSNHLILYHPLLLLPSNFPSIRVFSKTWLFTSGGQNIGASASASVLPMNFQDWYLLGLNPLISLLSKGLSIVFSSTTVQKHQFFSAQPSLWYNSHIHTRLLLSTFPKTWNKDSVTSLGVCQTAEKSMSLVC